MWWSFVLILTTALYAWVVSSVIERYGALDAADSAPPIELHVRRYRAHAQTAHVSPVTDDTVVEIRVIDRGTGLPQQQQQMPLERTTSSASASASTPYSSPPHNTATTSGPAPIRPIPFAFFHTTDPDPVADQSGYSYSRRFGSSMSGMGVGLSVAQQYCRFMGGTLVLLNGCQYAAPAHGGQSSSSSSAHGATAIATMNASGTASDVHGL